MLPRDMGAPGRPDLGPSTQSIWGGGDRTCLLFTRTEFLCTCCDAESLKTAHPSVAIKPPTRTSQHHTPRPPPPWFLFDLQFGIYYFRNGSLSPFSVSGVLFKSLVTLSKGWLVLFRLRPLREKRVKVRESWCQGELLSCCRVFFFKVAQEPLISSPPCCFDYITHSSLSNFWQGPPTHVRRGGPP